MASGNNGDYETKIHDLLRWRLKTLMSSQEVFPKLETSEKWSSGMTITLEFRTPAENITNLMYFSTATALTSIANMNLGITAFSALIVDLKMSIKITTNLSFNKSSINSLISNTLGILQTSAQIQHNNT